MDKKDSVILGKISKTLEDLMKGKNPSKISDISLSELDEVITTINKLIDFADQTQKFLFTLSKGILNQNIPPPENFLSSPLKELNSRLMQITYQAQQVAKGDYTQRIDFMGDFTNAFNNMVAALEEKEISLKESEKEARLNKQRLELAIHAANLAWWEWEVKTDRLDYDFRRTDLVGYNLNEYPKFEKDVYDTIHPDDKEKFEKAISAHLKGKNQEFNVEYRMKHKNGYYIWVHDRGKVTEFDSLGNPAKVSGLIFDITDKKDFEEKLMESEKILRDSNTAKDKLFSIISHDLRGPIGSIYQFLDYVSVNPEQFSQEELHEVLSNMRNTSKVTYEMLDNLLLWARSQSSKIEYRPDIFNSFEVLVDTKNFLDVIAKNKELSIKIKAKPDLFAFADKESIKTVLRNLLSNAIKFSHKNGEIILEARKLQDENKVLFSVKDFGVGIPEKTFARIFTVDVKSSSLGTSGEKGSGLGLLLCKEFIDANKGSIWVESEKDKGSVFSFTLPLP
ncbi:MAG: PAS domain-containing protein [Ignavibacteria bacterium]|nr:PAS domain-containing protein [Ignavibacteria bacterium]